METCSFLPFVDCLKNSKVVSTIKAVKTMPKNLEQCKAEDEALVLKYYNEDLSSPSTFQQELKLWKRYWANENEKPKTQSKTISAIFEKQIVKMFPN